MTYFSGTLLSVLLLVVLNSSCRSGPETPAADAVVSSDNSGTKSASTAKGTVPKPVEQALYLKALEAELRSGVRVPQHEAHLSQGTLACRKEGSFDKCSIRVLTGTRFTTPSPADQPVAEAVWKHIQRSGRDFHASADIYVDFTCRYVGQKTPPYNLEDVTCALGAPRLRHQAVFTGRTAEDLMAAIRAAFADRATPQGGSTGTLKTIVICHVVQPTGRKSCIARTPTLHGSGEDIRELSHSTASAIANILMAIAAPDQEPVTGTSQAPAQGVSQVSATVECASSEAAAPEKNVCQASL